MSSFGTYIFGWLVGYSGPSSAPSPGIMVADYFLLRRRHLVVPELYRANGLYTYARGFNPRALLALIAGVVAALIGLFVPTLRPLYDYAWFIGFFLSAAVYLALSKR